MLGNGGERKRMTSSKVDRLNYSGDGVLWEDLNHQIRYRSSLTKSLDVNPKSWQ